MARITIIRQIAITKRFIVITPGDPTTEWN